MATQYRLYNYVNLFYAYENLRLNIIEILYNSVETMKVIIQLRVNKNYCN